MTAVKGSAMFIDSDTLGRQRVRLDRWWSDEPRALVCMANPSTAGAEESDPTIRAVIALCRNIPGIGGFTVVNECARVFTDPADLRAWRDAAARDHYAEWRAMQARNFAFIRELSEKAPIRIAAWGNLVAAPAHVIQMLSADHHRPIHCWGTTKSGAPKHPLARGKHRIASDSQPIIYREAQS